MLFLEKDNVSTLWDVISDEDIFKLLSSDIKTKILHLFTNNIKGFYEIERTKNANLVNLNKKYILLILNYIKQNCNKQNCNINKIKISDEPLVKEMITYEEIKTDRKSKFDIDLTKRQEEFTDTMTLKIPNVPDFADKYEDKPITEIDKIIKEMTVKRNYEIEQINRNYSSNTPNNWLKSQNTSNKNIHLMDENHHKKSVSWEDNTRDDDNNTRDDDNIKYMEYDNNMEDCNMMDDNIIDENNIFKKLKKIEIKEDERMNHLENEIKLLKEQMEMFLIKFKGK
jgi:hypothetical protein